MLLLCRFPPSRSTLLDCRWVFKKSATLSPGLIPIYNSAFSLGLAANPFAGTGVTWSVTAATNVPGTSTEGMLQTNTIDVGNSSPTTYYLMIQVLSQPYTLPGSSGSTVVASTTFSNSSVADASATLTSDIDSTPIGTVVFAGPGTSPTTTIDYVRGATYSLLDTFLITLNGHPLNDPPSIANITITSTVTPDPAAEPWNCLSVVCMAIPVGLVYLKSRRFRRRRAGGDREGCQGAEPGEPTEC